MKRCRFLALVALALLPWLVACGASDDGGFSLADAPEALDIGSVLPAGFEHIDPATEQLSNRDLGLGPDFSEVEVFLREEPLQLVFLYLTVNESRLERAMNDAMLKDDAQIEALVVDGLRAGAAEEGVFDLSVTDVQVTHPDIGSVAALGEGNMGAFGISMGFDFLMFRIGDTYVFVISTYFSGQNVSLVPAGNLVANRIYRP